MTVFMIISAMSKNNKVITKNFYKSSFKIQNFSGEIWKRQRLLLLEKMFKLITKHR